MSGLFTLMRILDLYKKNKQRGECLNGQYWWSSDMILIEDGSFLCVLTYSGRWVMGARDGELIFIMKMVQL